MILSEIRIARKSTALPDIRVAMVRGTILCDAKWGLFDVAVRIRGGVAPGPGRGTGSDKFLLIQKIYILYIYRVLKNRESLVSERAKKIQSRKYLV